MKRKIYLVLLPILLLVMLVQPAIVKAQAPQTVLSGGYVATVVGYTRDGQPIFQTNFAAPTYCDDLKTRISTEWYENEDGTFTSGDNKFDSNVSNEKIKVAKDSEYMEWTPTLSLSGADSGKDLKLNAQNVKPEILDEDPMNENYHRNTLVWHYDNGVDRFLRLIEGQIQEYFVLNNELQNDLVIDPNPTQTENFDWYDKAIAYDKFGTGIQLHEDENKKVTIKATSLKQNTITEDVNEALVKHYEKEVKDDQQKDIQNGLEPEVQYPVVIDPNYTFVSSASDGYIYAVTGVYNNAWAAVASYAINSSAIDSYLGQQKSGSYSIWRSALYFDTTV